MTETLPVAHKSSGHNGFTNDWAGMPYPLKYARAKVMLDNGASYSEVHASTGLAPATIAKVKRGEMEIDHCIAETLKKTEGVQLTHLIHGTLNSITGEDVQKASFLQKVTGAGILIDKRELLEGRPTQRTAFAGQKDEALDAEIQALQEKLGVWEQGKVINAVTLPVEIESVDGHKD